VTAREIESLELANKAYALMSRMEQQRVLLEMAKLHYASVIDRWFEAVHRVIADIKGSK